MTRIFKAIKTPDGAEVKYDGSIPEHLDISDGRIAYSEADVQKAYEVGLIDDVNRVFLLNLLAEYRITPDVIKAVMLYRSRIERGLKPGQELFIRMQELGLKHHLKMEHNTGLNIAGYELPGIELGEALIDGDLNMNHTVVRGGVSLAVARLQNLRQQNAEIKGDVDMSFANFFSIHQDKAKIGGDLSQRHMHVYDAVLQNDTVIGGELCQRNAVIGGVLQQLNVTVGGHVDQESARIDGSLHQIRMKIGGCLDQSNVEIGGNLDQRSAEIRGYLNQSGAKIRNGLRQEDAVFTEPDGPNKTGFFAKLFK